LSSRFVALRKDRFVLKDQVIEIDFSFVEHSYKYGILFTNYFYCYRFVYYNCDFII